MTVEQALMYHAELYPLMRPADAVKLLYQNEFGGGHLIENPKKSLMWLESELASTAHDARLPLTVPIGNGIVRVNLAALDTDKTPLSEFNRIFVKSSEAVHGCLESFLEKTALLKKLTDTGIFTFSPAELNDYITAYAERGYPMVSHSEEYRRAYRPAYRVVLSELIDTLNE